MTHLNEMQTVCLYRCLSHLRVTDTEQKGTGDANDQVALLDSGSNTQYRAGRWSQGCSAVPQCGDPSTFRHDCCVLLDRTRPETTSSGRVVIECQETLHSLRLGGFPCLRNLVVGKLADGW
ncbi:hypothetical protein [Bythopirellula goksoeyrii]|uniref:hypothetical protein n=1 Tax=Bythopirellula goksoeyrii TaxID=1400387 RepID=UPI0011CE2D05|nr:hypothetical protein [Bythopirellula goksoeyrii]